MRTTSESMYKMSQNVLRPRGRTRDNLDQLSNM